jgi:hypothetical protein
MQYKIITGRRKAVETEVQLLLNLDWKLYSGVNTTWIFKTEYDPYYRTTNEYFLHYTQTMIKEDES